MGVENEIRRIAAGIAEKRPYIRGEESTKDALIRPMIRALGYDTSNPAEVIAEFTADFGTRRHEKVDFAILSAGRPIILIECKTISSRLGNNEIAQLFRYFSATDARFAILTNGVVWKFFTDLGAVNRMDEEPFLSVNLEELDDFHFASIARFAKQDFDENAIHADAEVARTMDAFCNLIADELHEPSDDFVRFFARRVHEGRLSSKAVAHFRPYVEEALQLIFDLLMDEALQAADASPSLERAPVGGRAADADLEFGVYADYVKSADGTKKLFADLSKEIKDLGTNVELMVRKSRFSFHRTDGRGERVFAAIHVRKRYLQAYLKVDPYTVVLQEGFSHDVREKFTPCGAPLLVMIRNNDDLERAKPLIKRSYDEAG